MSGVTGRFVALLLVAISGAACSGSSGPTDPERQSVVGAGVELILPTGWTSATVPGVGLVVAASETNLDTDVPDGPRLVASPASGSVPDPGPLLASAEEEQPVIRTDPVSVTVDGNPGVGVEMTLTRGGVSLVSRLVVVDTGEGVAYTFTLEAPEDQWAANAAELEGMLASAQFTAS